MKFERHFFVCCNDRPEGGKPACSHGDSRAVLAALRKGAAALGGRVAATECGCLGPCFDGPNLVVYPEGVWYAGVTLADVPELVRSHMEHGIPVQRLIYVWDDD